MRADDPQRKAARARFLEAVRSEYGLDLGERHAVPYADVSDQRIPAGLSLQAAARPMHNNNPPAEPEVFRLLPPQRGLIAIDEKKTHGAGWKLS